MSMSYDLFLLFCDVRHTKHVPLTYNVYIHSYIHSLYLLLIIFYLSFLIR